MYPHRAYIVYNIYLLCKKLIHSIITVFFVYYKMRVHNNLLLRK